MGEPIWILWVAGLAAVVGGPLLFKHREQAAYVIRQSNPFFDSSKDSTGEGGNALPSGDHGAAPGVARPVLCR